MTRNIFTYGTLMFPQVWSLVVDGNYQFSEAVLKGYDRKGVKGDVYPVIIPSTVHSRVQGLVYFDVSFEDLSRLDDFEGEYYFRKSEQVLTREAVPIPADVYILKEDYYGILSSEDWDMENFKKTCLQRFISDHLDRNENK